MSGIINSNTVTQVGIIVKDIEETLDYYSKFLGVEKPAIIEGGDYEITKTKFMGKPAPYSNCRLAFFNVNENFVLELIEPNGHPSAWQKQLDEKGEGLHHIAFVIDGMDNNIKSCAGFGMELLQIGEYGDASGRYAYLDASSKLKTIIELLEND